MSMAMQEKKKNPRNVAMVLDLMHIVIGILVIICTVFAFLNPEKNQILFPVIFCLAALLNAMNGRYKILSGGRDKKIKAGGAVQCVVAGLLLAVGIVSAISIWR